MAQSVSQDNQSLVQKIKVLCEAITSSSDQVMEKIQIFGALKREEGASYFPGYIADSSCVFDHNEIKGRLGIYHKKDSSIKKYELWLTLHADYELDKNKTPVFGMPNAPKNISYEQLRTLFGKAVSNYKFNIQPKDTKHFHFNYTNPKTKRKCIINIISFNPPESGYNIIYDIYILNAELNE